jgi:hypothetical protein
VPPVHPLQNTQEQQIRQRQTFQVNSPKLGTPNPPPLVSKVSVSPRTPASSFAWQINRSSNSSFLISIACAYWPIWAWTLRFQEWK